MHLQWLLAKEKMLQIKERVPQASRRNVRSAGVVMRERNRATRGSLMRAKLLHAVLEGNLKGSKASMYEAPAESQTESLTEMLSVGEEKRPKTLDSKVHMVSESEAIAEKEAIELTEVKEATEVTELKEATEAIEATEGTEWSELVGMMLMKSHLNQGHRDSVATKLRSMARVRKDAAGLMTPSSRARTDRDAGRKPMTSRMNMVEQGE